MSNLRQLGLCSAAALVVANMIGTGVFTTTGFLLADLKSPGLVLLAWAVGGIIALLGALSYGALARAIPESGGEYIYLTRTVHPAAGFLAGWVSLLAGFSAPIAAVAFGFGEYLELWLPDWNPKLTGTLLLLACTVTHVHSVKGGALLQNAAVALKLIVLTALILIGLAHLPELAPQASEPSPATGNNDAFFPFSAFAVSLVWISFSYAGWNAAIYIASEIREPDRNLPGSLLLGTVVVTALYLGVNAVFVFAAPVDELAGRLEIGRIAAEKLGGAGWENAVTLLVALALATSASAMMMAGPRVYAKMAENRCLPEGFAFRSGKPPRNATLLQLALALAFLWTGTFEGLLTYIGFTLGLSSAATVAGLLLLARRQAHRVRIPGGFTVPVVFLIFAVYSVGFTIQRKPTESLLGAGTLLLGWFAWQLTARQRGNARKGE